jgi:predicted RND superfamily exporter protein
MQTVAAENESFGAALQNADTDGNGVPDRNLAALYDQFYAADSQVASQVIERTEDGQYRSLLVTLSLNADFSQTDEIVASLDAGAAEMEGDGRSATAAGGLAVNDAVLDEIVSGILLTMLIAMLAIVLTLMGVFKGMHGSASLGAVVAVPIALVICLVVGGMYLLGIPLTLLTALLMSLVIGLGVDYNIHIGDRFADELRAGMSPSDALVAAVTGTGGALVGSTLTSTGAFATITLVPEAQLQSFGVIVVVALLTAFVTSVLVLPSMLWLWARYADPTVVSPEPAAEAAT